MIGRRNFCSQMSSARFRNCQFIQTFSLMYLCLGTINSKDPHFLAGVFFIPYMLFLFTCGIPLFFLETALGQYTSQGGITCWRKICPLFQGTLKWLNFPVVSSQNMNDNIFIASSYLSSLVSFSPNTARVITHSLSLLWNTNVLLLPLLILRFSFSQAWAMPVT